MFESCSPLCELVQRTLPVIANREAIAVNQQYAGHPGRLVKQWSLAELNARSALVR